MSTGQQSAVEVNRLPQTSISECMIIRLHGEIQSATMPAVYCISGALGSQATFLQNETGSYSKLHLCRGELCEDWADLRNDLTLLFNLILIEQVADCSLNHNFCQGGLLQMNNTVVM